MSTLHLLLVLTSLIAVVALVVALYALVRLRRLSAPPAAAPQASTTVAVAAREPAEAPARQVEPDHEPYQIVEGKVVVRPTTHQVVNATMGRPLVRLNIVVFGLAHALRPESRDHIRGLMRREFRARKRLRRTAARRAALQTEPANSSTPVRLDPDTRREIER